MAARVTKHDIEVLVGPSTPAPSPSSQYIDSDFITSAENLNNDTNLSSLLETNYIESTEDIANIYIHTEYNLYPSYIETSGIFSSAFIDLYIDPNFIDTNESFGSELNLYPASFIDPNFIESEEILIIDKAYAESYINVVAISSQETFKKQIVFPKPFPGTVYNWYEILSKIESELH